MDMLHGLRLRRSAARSERRAGGWISVADPAKALSLGNSAADVSAKSRRSLGLGGSRHQNCSNSLFGMTFCVPPQALFMLVSALMGLERMQAVYAHAIANEYRFYSYGDASLLLPQQVRA